MDQAMFNLIVGTLLRSAIAGAAGWLVAKGMLPQGNVEEWVGAVLLFVLGIGWSLYQKYAHRVLLKTALESPAGTSEAEVKAKIANGLGATLSGG